MSLSSLSRVGQVNSSQTSNFESSKEVSGQSFKNTLDGLFQKKNLEASPFSEIKNEALKFSNHAIDRMNMRGLHFDSLMMDKIEDAVGRAEEKGAKNTLVVAGDSALIVSVENKTVVTVMDKTQLKENVFTNIDSTVIV
jgi:flagellar operon protein